MKKETVEQQAGGDFLSWIVQNFIQGAVGTFVSALVSLLSVRLGCIVFILFVVSLCLQKYWQNRAWLVLKGIDNEDVKKTNND